MSTNPAGPPLSPFRTHQDVVFTSGQIGVDDGGTIPDDFAAQARLSIEALRRQLEASGASLQSTLKTTVFIKRREDFAAMNAIYVEYFGDPFPARSTIVCDLALPELLFEIEAIASVVAGSAA